MPEDAGDDAFASDDFFFGEVGEGGVDGFVGGGGVVVARGLAWVDVYAAVGVAEADDFAGQVAFADGDGAVPAFLGHG